MAAQECLSNKCIDVVVNNFETLPVHENIPARCMREISNRLSIDLDANTAAEFVFDESYWKRRCLQKYPQCNSKISEHGLMWKQLFFETHIQQLLEEFEPDSDVSKIYLSHFESDEFPRETAHWHFSQPSAPAKTTYSPLRSVSLYTLSQSICRMFADTAVAGAS